MEASGPDLAEHTMVKGYGSLDMRTMNRSDREVGRSSWNNELFWKCTEFDF